MWLTTFWPLRQGPDIGRLRMTSDANPRRVLAFSVPSLPQGKLAGEWAHSHCLFHSRHNVQKFVYSNNLQEAKNGINVPLQDKFNRGILQVFPL